MKDKKKREKKGNFIRFWKRRILDVLRKDESMSRVLRGYNFYSDGTGTYSGKDYVTYYYTIDGYPREIPTDFKDYLRREAKDTVRVSFISLFEPTRIEWGSASVESRLRTWRNIANEEKDVDEFSYQKNLGEMDSNAWRKQSLLYLSDADIRRKRKMFKYRTLIVVSGVRGSAFDKTIYEMKEYAKAIRLDMNRVDSYLFEFLDCFSPFSLERSDRVFEMVGTNTITDELLARFSTYSQGKIGKEGDYWGTDIYSGFPVFKITKKDSVDAENIFITAETGGGKSFFLKILLLQLLSKSTYNGTINDIEGFEYISLAGFVANNDEVVILNMAEGQGCYFDPVEINLTGDEKLDKNMYSFSSSFTLSVIRTLLGEEVQKDPWVTVAVDNAVSKTYSDAGIEPNDPTTWEKSIGLTLYDVYRKFRDLYKECIGLVAKYGYSGNEDGESDSIDLSKQYKRNIRYREALDIVIAKLSVFFEDLSHGGIRSNVFSKRVTFEDIRHAKLVVCSFGMAGKSMDSVDPISMGLAQLSASNISHIRSIFSKADGKYNFKVWEEFQRWGAMPGSEAAIKTAITGGRKLGDINFIVTNDVKELLDRDRFSIMNNISSFAIGSIVDDDTRSEICRRLSVPGLKGELDNLVLKKGNTETFENDEYMASIYDKAFLVSFDKSVSTIVRMDVPRYLAESDLLRTGVNLSE